MNPIVCKLVILTVRGILLCGATGYNAEPQSFTSGSQKIYDVELDAQYCVPTDDLKRAYSLPFEQVASKLRADQMPMPLGDCPQSP